VRLKTLHSRVFLRLKEMKLKLYTVSDEYINHLRTVEAKVPNNNYNNKKPFVGVVFEINDKSYLAPLTSPKVSIVNIKNGCPSVFKLHEQDNVDHSLGAVRIQYMIPVPSSELTELDFDSRGNKYRKLLDKQILFIRKHEDEVKKRASKLYSLVAKKVPFFSKISCDFQALEAAMNDYVTEKV
jgi:protein AbiQ